MKIEDIRSDIDKKCVKAVGISQTKIRRKLSDRIKSYYSSYTPQIYKRTWQLKSSLDSQHNGLHAVVRMNDEEVNYKEHGSGTSSPEIYSYNLRGYHGMNKNGVIKTYPIWTNNELDSRKYVKDVVGKSLRDVGLNV